MTLSKRFVSLLGSALIVAAMAGYARADGEDGYAQTNLVSDGAVPANFTDPHLKNPWGISFIPGLSPFWVSDNNAGVTTLYDGTGSPFPAPATPLVVDIPLPTDPTKGGNAGAPTGQVANLTILTATPGFSIGSSGPALFIFATEDGTIEAWNQAIPEPDGTPSPNLGVSDDAVIVVDNSAGTKGGGPAGAVYKGLAMGTSMSGATKGQSFLYATNFRTGKIDVFDTNFKPATLSGSFTDHGFLRNFFAPFGIQNINGELWVAYAVQDAAKHDPIRFPGFGFVDVFDTDGHLLRRFAQFGFLDAPWGVALAPASFGEFANDILIGNFGNGVINAYDPTSGEFRGVLRDRFERPLVNPGLWTVTFSGPKGQTAMNATPDTLYFTAGLRGPTHENDGLFGTISPNTDSDSGDE
jgi:uncharacterized protein (TIGR03118 family)